jgi:hypothetical protein
MQRIVVFCSITPGTPIGKSAGAGSHIVDHGGVHEGQRAALQIVNSTGIERVISGNGALRDPHRPSLIGETPARKVANIIGKDRVGEA